ncbi:ATP-binding cassette domain-containing protein [Rhodobacterales bacterium HKCCE2091]|nr:ATP-binding cassette domain-containing protein [Rhodobacterales bacterium HKCCE2091]
MAGPQPRSAPPPVLDLSIRSVDFGGGSILGPVALSLAPGETVAVTGPSGIGKSTLLRIVAGLVGRADASVTVRGRVSMVFQEPTLLSWRSVLANLRIACRIDRSRALSALSEVGLAGLGSRYPGQLSLGQRRRLALARAFAVGPDLLLMDEPFVSLDDATHAEMMALFARLRARHGTATLLVTHDMREAEALATRIVALGGRPAVVTGERQNAGAYRQLSASGVTAFQS